MNLGFILHKLRMSISNNLYKYFRFIKGLKFNIKLSTLLGQPIIEDVKRNPNKTCYTVKVYRRPNSVLPFDPTKLTPAITWVNWQMAGPKDYDPEPKIGGWYGNSRIPRKGILSRLYPLVYSWVMCDKVSYDEDTKTLIFTVWIGK